MSEVKRAKIMKPILGYWAIRGLAQAARLLLAYNNVDYEDRLYECKKNADGTYDRSEWTNVKYSDELALDFPNIPYYIDENVRITQSNAILRYLGRKYNLVADTPESLVEMDMLEGVLGDFSSGFTRLCYSNQFHELRDGYVNGRMTDFIGRFDTWLSKRKWAAGDKLTHVDFRLYDLLDQHRKLAKDIVEKFPNVFNYIKQFEALENMKSYFNDPNRVDLPLNNTSASFR